MSQSGENIDCAFNNQLYNQWMRRETWCAVTGVIPNYQRRHYPYKWFHEVSLCSAGGGSASPYKASGGRAVYFPRPRRMFPDIKNRSSLSGQF